MSDSLDAAWAEAEAALPHEWRIESLEQRWDDSWEAGSGSSGSYIEAQGATPAEALRNLAAKLRGVRPEWRPVQIVDAAGHVIGTRYERVRG